MNDKESILIKFLKFVGIIKPYEISKKEMCDRAKSICNKNCDSCTWR